MRQVEYKKEELTYWKSFASFAKKIQSCTHTVQTDEGVVSTLKFLYKTGDHKKMRCSKCGKVVESS